MIHFKTLYIDWSTTVAIATYWYKFNLSTTKKQQNLSFNYIHVLQIHFHQKDNLQTASIKVHRMKTLHKQNDTRDNKVKIF